LYEEKLITSRPSMTHRLGPLEPERQVLVAGPLRRIDPLGLDLEVRQAVIGALDLDQLGRHVLDQDQQRPIGALDRQGRAEAISRRLAEGDLGPDRPLSRQGLELDVALEAHRRARPTKAGPGHVGAELHGAVEDQGVDGPPLA
jgi:hypothetical protein